MNNQTIIADDFEKRQKAKQQSYLDKFDWEDLRAGIYKCGGVTSGIRALHVKYDPSDETWQAAVSWSKLVVANYWSVFKTFNELVGYVSKINPRNIELIWHEQARP